MSHRLTIYRHQNTFDNAQVNFSMNSITLLHSSTFQMSFLQKISSKCAVIYLCFSLVFITINSWQSVFFEILMMLFWVWRTYLDVENSLICDRVVDIKWLNPDGNVEGVSQDVLCSFMRIKNEIVYKEVSTTSPAGGLS